MNAYRFSSAPCKAISAQEAKARRQAVLQRVRTQRAAAAKKTAAEWMQEGVIIRASELKERYQRGKRAETSTERSEEK